MRRSFAVVIISAFAVGVSAPAAYAGQGNPSGVGPPSQSCQDIALAGGTTPGHAASSPGSPFNEPGPNSNGGTGGLHYTESSQYDVACYHVS
jgi:hypothetical protein